jgi:putative Holliday junction resolvase
MRYLGLDVGDSRIGVAVSDETATLASGRDTLVRVGRRRDLARIALLAREHDARGIVVGLPLNMDGSRGPQAEKALVFMEDLRRSTGLPVVAWDERLTSVEAEEILARARVRARGKDRKKIVDQVAAVVILQEFLDHREARDATETTA